MLIKSQVKKFSIACFLIKKKGMKYFNHNASSLSKKLAQLKLVLTPTDRLQGEEHHSPCQRTQAASLI